jgi:hypothetical protein
VAAVVAAAAAVSAHAPAVSAATRASLPNDRLHFGLGNDPGGQSWFSASHVPWRYRYTYLAGGINLGGAAADPCGANNGWQTWNSPAGAYATNYMQSSATLGAIPVFSYYEIVQSNPSPGDESAELTKIANVCTMQAYWADFTVLMQKAGAFGGIVVVHVEPDFWGFMEHQSSDPTTIPAVVASSGNPDLAGLPNSVAGMGLAFLKLRDRYAPNALLAIHASSWASGVDIASDTRTSVDANAEADKVAAFLNKAGIAGNPNGITPWDVIFNDVADHDAGYSGRWWDRTNAVYPNFARWLAFMNRLHADTGVPLIEWQVPVGNQYFDTMNNTAGHYQDNRAEYFLAHPDQLTAAGIVAVLFGKANQYQTDYADDDADGVTNPAPIATWQCNLCNNHVSNVTDDDGGYLRMAVGAYYRTFPGTSCAMFPFDSVFNTDISTLPVNPQSATWLSNMNQNADVHPDLGTFAQEYGIPINVAPPPSTGVAPAFTYDSESDHPAEGYPVDQSTLIEGGAGAPSGSDRHALVIDKNRCKLYELYNLQNFTNGQTPVAGSGATWSLSSNAMRADGWTSADAAGLPIAPLLLRPDEIQAGTIAHAIRFTAHCTSTYIWPASHQAGSCTSAFPPMGARFRLRSTYDISSFSPDTQVVLRAFQHYGLILADNGSDWFFQGTTDDWWGTSAGAQVSSELKTVPASQFDAVDESGLQVAAGSYQSSVAALPPAPCATPSLSGAPASQQATGAAVVFTAATSRCTHPTYRFLLAAPGHAFAVVQDYGPANTYTWTATGLAGTYRVEVDVRDQASAAGYEAWTQIGYTLAGCGSARLAASPASPAAPGGTVTLKASATCAGTPAYRFLVGGSVVQAYSTSNTYVWNTAGLALGSYSLEVDVRNQGASAGYEAWSILAYSLAQPRCSTPTLSAAPPAKAPTGASVTLTATTSTCPTPNYRFLVGRNGVFTVVQPYGAANTFTWNTAGQAAGAYVLEVDVRDQSSSAGYEAWAQAGYNVVACTAATLTTDKPSPQPGGAGIVLTATATCPTAAEYRFLVNGVVVQAYSTSNTFTWSSSGTGNQSLEVDVRNRGSTLGYEAWAIRSFGLT